MNNMTTRNPFLGPRPYRAEDADLFFGREDVTRRLANRILARPTTTVFGPSGAGKSSLLHAAVLPELSQQRFHVISIEGWPVEQEPISLLFQRALEVLHASDDHSAPQPPSIVICLDQLEQLLYQGRSHDSLGQLLDGLSNLVDSQSSQIRLILALREDYLGRFRDRARRHVRLLDHGFRVTPFTVTEIAEALEATARKGSPPQEGKWNKDDLIPTVRELRSPGTLETDDAEVEAVYVQILCRARWANITSGSTTIDAAPAKLVQDYFDDSISSLGPAARSIRTLLETYLIDETGHRALVTEGQVLTYLHKTARTTPKESRRIIAALEESAILAAEEHADSRYFELGHDWLAGWLKESRRQRSGRKRRLYAGLTVAALVGITAVVVAANIKYGQLAKSNAERAAEIDSTTKALNDVLEKSRSQVLIVEARGALQNGNPDDAAILLASLPDELVEDSVQSDIVQVLTEPLMSLRIATRGKITGWCFAPSGNTAVTLTRDGTIERWDASSGERLGSLSVTVPTKAEFKCINDELSAIVGDDSTDLVHWRQDKTISKTLHGHKLVSASATGQTLMTRKQNGHSTGIELYNADGESVDSRQEQNEIQADRWFLSTDATVVLTECRQVDPSASPSFCSWQVGRPSSGSLADEPTRTSLSCDMDSSTVRIYRAGQTDHFLYCGHLLTITSGGKIDIAMLPRLGSLSFEGDDSSIWFYDDYQPSGSTDVLQLTYVHKQLPVEVAFDPRFVSHVYHRDVAGWGRWVTPSDLTWEEWPGGLRYVGSVSRRQFSARGDFIEARSRQLRVVRTDRPSAAWGLGTFDVGRLDDGFVSVLPCLGECDYLEALRQRRLDGRLTAEWVRLPIARSPGAVIRASASQGAGLAIVLQTDSGFEVLHGTLTEGETEAALKSHRVKGVADGASPENEPRWRLSVSSDGSRAALCSCVHSDCLLSVYPSDDPEASYPVTGDCQVAMFPYSPRFLVANGDDVEVRDVSSPGVPLEVVWAGEPPLLSLDLSEDEALLLAVRSDGVDVVSLEDGALRTVVDPDTRGARFGPRDHRWVRWSASNSRSFSRERTLVAEEDEWQTLNSWQWPGALEDVWLADDEEAVDVRARNTLHRIPLSKQGLVHLLRESVQLCLSAEDRKRFLGQTDEEAQRGLSACESEHASLAR